MAEEKRRPNKNEAMEALEAICGKYRIRIQDVLRFAPVYYPIAIMEMHLEEENFEDFETVQLTVLRLVNLGIRDPGVIARTLSLTSTYVQRMLHLLTGYGHISGGKVTELGRQSMERGQKITLTGSMQKFQMDALNGTLLKVDQTVTENGLNDKSHTRLSIPHMNYPDGISAKALSNQLAGANSSKYLQHKSGILHSNVRRITDARCVQLQYAAGFMMKLKDQQPIVFAKRYDSSKKDMKDRFSWQPFSVKSAAVAERYGFEKSTTVSTGYAERYLTELYDLMEEESRRLDMEPEAVTAVSKLFHLPEEDLYYTEGWRYATVDIGDAEMTRYRSNLLPLLMALGTEGNYIITTEYLMGRLVSVVSDNPKQKALGKLLAQKVEAKGRSAVSHMLREKFRDYQGEENLLSAMSRALEAM